MAPCFVFTGKLSVTHTADNDSRFWADAPCRRARLAMSRLGSSDSGEIA